MHETYKCPFCNDYPMLVCTRGGYKYYSCGMTSNVGTDTRTAAKKWNSLVCRIEEYRRNGK